MSTHHIPIMFDVSFVANREDAARLVVEALAEAGITSWLPDPSVPLRPPVGSWWTIDARDKKADRNDNDAGVVVFPHDRDIFT